MSFMSANLPDGGKPVTGRTVAYWFFGFFAPVFAVNAVMIWLAIDSWSGQVTQSAYKAGRGYQSEINAGREQASKGWQVELDIARNGPGTEITARLENCDAHPLSDLAVSATFTHPTGDGQDVHVPLVETTLGTYQGVAKAVPEGIWIVVVEAYGGEERLYLSRNRVRLR